MRAAEEESPRSRLPSQPAAQEAWGRRVPMSTPPRARRLRLGPLLPKTRGLPVPEEATGEGGGLLAGTDVLTSTGTGRRRGDCQRLLPRDADYKAFIRPGDATATPQRWDRRVSNPDNRHAAGSAHRSTNSTSRKITQYYFHNNNVVSFATSVKKLEPLGNLCHPFKVHLGVGECHPKAQTGATRS